MTPNALTLTVRSGFLDADEEAFFEERAAIREYDGGLPRAAAERLAMLEVMERRSQVATTGERAA